MVSRIPANSENPAAAQSARPDACRDDLSAEDYYGLINDKIRSLYPEGISEERCHAATRNFIGFGKLLLEMKRQKGLDDEG